MQVVKELSDPIVVDALRGGSFVVARTDTIYGILCSANDENAVKRLREIRGRDATQGFIILADSVETVAKMVDLKSDVFAKLSNIWPAKVSVVLKATDHTPAWLMDTRDDDTIAFRVPADKTWRELLRKTGPLCAPSANKPGENPARSIDEARKIFGKNVVYVNGGRVMENSPSRLIKFDSNGDEIVLRKSALDNVISRKRKKFKFARFDELDSCFHLDEWTEKRDEWIDVAKDLVVEIGAGSALFLVEQAKLAPEKQFIAVDIKGDRLYQGARDAARAELTNIVFVRSDIAKITDVIPAKSVSEIWLTFSDPYPRGSDAKHRLTAPRYLNYYREILAKNGILHFKTDNHGLFDWSLEQFVANDWDFAKLTYDLHESDLPETAKIMTSYEKRFVDEGLKIMYAQILPQ